MIELTPAEIMALNPEHPNQRRALQAHGSALVHLIVALNQATERINALEARVTELEGR